VCPRLAALTSSTNGQQGPPLEAEAAEPEAEAPPLVLPRTSDPPLSPFYAGTVCARQHDDGTGHSLRRRSNNGCLQCEQVTQHGRKTRAQPVRLVPPLPGYLTESAYLSDERCPEWLHRYRGTAWTLRYRDDDTCVQCVTSRAVAQLERRRA
jgi:hypothetical protein